MIEDFGQQSLAKLPSKGKFYPESHPFHNKEFVALDAMRVKDEALLMNPVLRRMRTVDEALLRRVTNIPDLDVGSLLAGDVAGIYFGLYIANYEYQMEQKVACQKCGTKNECIILMDTFPMRTCDEYPSEPFKNSFIIELEKREAYVELKFPTHADHLDSTLEGNGSATKFLERVILSVNGVEDKLSLKQFIASLGIRESSMIRSFISKNEPGVIAQYKFFCENRECTHKNVFGFGYGAEMFGLEPKDRELALLEPAWLLSYLGGEPFDKTWEWPVAYRRWWIKRIEKNIQDRSKNKDDISDKDPIHNDPMLRQMLGKDKIEGPNARGFRF